MSDAPLSAARHWWVILLCSLVCLLDGYDVLVAPISVPVWSEQWQLQASAFTPALAATVLGMALGAVFIAPLGDRHGRRPVLALSFAVVGVASLMTARADSVLELTLYRVVTGLGMGASLTNALALASEVALPHLRTRITVWVYSMSAVGSIIGGLVAPAILERLSWQGLFYTGGVLPLALAPLLWFGLPAGGGSAPAAGAAGGLAGIMRNLGALLAAPYRATTLLLWLFYFVCLFTMYVISSWLPTLMHMNGWTLAASVRGIMYFSLGGVLGGFVIGWLVDRRHTALALYGGFAVAGLALLALLVAPADLFLWMSLVGLVGAGVVGVSYAIGALAAATYPAELRAGGIGTASAMGRLGATLAPVFGGWLIAGGASVLEIFASLVAVVALGLVAVFVFSRVGLPLRDAGG
ncbi:MFS transporter [Mangrovimicrobium sediminis]|uniref:MFS transporter n=1 Tax=Mangrovimicrobium sediminis TaxID=2562682 RepID=UPI001436801E|nr:MFS transporter [Haliea sp. SAOS-164]